MIEIEKIAKETQEALQTIAAEMPPDCEEIHPESQEDETMLPEDYRHTISDAISSLCEDICQHPNAIDNMARAGAVRILAEAQKQLSDVSVQTPLQLMQRLKVYCATQQNCSQCELSGDTCGRLLGANTPESWDLEG